MRARAPGVAGSYQTPRPCVGRGGASVAAGHPGQDPARGCRAVAPSASAARSHRDRPRRPSAILVIDGVDRGVVDDRGLVGDLDPVTGRPGRAVEGVAGTEQLDLAVLPAQDQVAVEDETPVGEVAPAVGEAAERPVEVRRVNSQSPISADTVWISPRTPLWVRVPWTRTIRGGAIGAGARRTISIPRARRTSGESSTGSVSGANPATTTRASAWKRWPAGPVGRRRRCPGRTSGAARLERQVTLEDESPVLELARVLDGGARSSRGRAGRRSRTPPRPGRRSG